MISNQIYDFYRINNLTRVYPVWLMIIRMVSYSIFLLNSIVFLRWMACKNSHVVRMWMSKTMAWLSVAIFIYSAAFITFVWIADDVFYEEYYFTAGSRFRDNLSPKEFKNFFQILATIYFGLLIFPSCYFYSAVIKYKKLADKEELEKSVNSHKDVLDEDRESADLGQPMIT